MRMTTVAASIGLADIGDYCLGIVVLALRAAIRASSASIVKTLERALCLRPTMYEVMK